MKTRVIQNEPDYRPTTPVVPAARTGVRGWVRDHRLVTFFVLAFVLAWWSWPLYQWDIWPRQAFQAVGALIAAVVVIALADGRPGFLDLGKRMIRWRVPWYYYAFALLVPLLVRWSMTLLNDAPSPDWLNLSWTGFGLWFLVRLINPLDGPLAEEPAWRGFAVPRLQAQHPPLVSAAILGVLVALWHLPLIGDTGWVGIVTTFTITFVYVWLFNRTGGSVLLVLLFHSAQGFITMGDLGYRGDGLARQQLLEGIAWAVIALALIVFDRPAWRRAPDAAIYHDDNR
jgi:membrane protease YdiL (CAAX protease family)